MRYLTIVASFFIVAVLVFCVYNNLFCQTYVTISNGETVEPNWYVSDGGSGVVNNPAPDEVNVSESCFKVVTSQSGY